MRHTPDLGTFRLLSIVGSRAQPQRGGIRPDRGRFVNG
jgi:hypothetical protein